MKSHITISFFLLQLILICQPESLSAQKYCFKHLMSEDGLSSNIVQCINKDSRGYLWIGCNNAVNRYNGSSFTKYFNNPNDSTSITSGSVVSIVEDMDSTLWIATINGVCLFNYRKEKFQKIFDAELENTLVKNLKVTRKNDLLVCTTNGTYLLNRNLKQFERFSQTSIDLQSSVIAEDTLGNLFIGTWGNGLLYWDKLRKDFLVGMVSERTELNDENKIESLAIDKKGTLWIGTRNGFYNGNLVRTDDKFHLKIDPVVDKIGSPLLSNTKIHCLTFDENEKLWIGTEDGLFIFNTKTHSYLPLRAQKDISDGINNNLINCLFHDQNNCIWVGTYQGGINLYSRGNTPFKDLLPYINQTEDKKIQYVKSVYQDPNQKLWVGTDYGLLRFSKDLQFEKSYANSAQQGSMPVGGVTAILTDTRNQFWVGTWGGGLSQLDTEANRFVKYSNHEGRNLTDSTLTGDSNNRALLEDNQGFIWVVNMFGMVDRYNRITKSFKHFDLATEVGRPNMEIKSVALDSKDNLWIGSTGAGLIKFDTKTLKPELFHTTENLTASNSEYLLNVDVYSVYVDKEDHIWMGTRHGLSCFDPQKNKITNYSEDRGLNAEMVLGVTSDKNENIWISTMSGISKLDQKSGYFSNFDMADGVISNAEVVYKSPNGVLFFAGVNGILAFNPDSIWTNQQIPPIVFTDFKLFDKSILFDNRILPDHINETEEITLRYSQNSLTIGFSALNFVRPDKNVYSCQLQGFETDWNFIGSKKEAKYTNLSPGTYFFKLRAANNSGVWNNKERVLKIVIRPPWWKTHLFRILVVVMIVMLTILIIRIRTLQLEHQKKELQEKVKKRTLEIEKQQIELKNQAETLLKTNLTLMQNQKEIELQKEAILDQKNKLEEKNLLLEEQKEQILQQKKLAEEMSNQLHEADINRIKFLTNVSHEFRTPLSLIISPLEKSLREYKTINPEKLHDRLKLMFRNAMRLIRLINEFLDISKIEEGLLKMNVGRGNIHNFIDGIVGSYRYLSEQKNIKLTFTSELEHVVCFFDADKIDKILNNLLSNAFKYTHSGGCIDVRLEVISKDENNEVDFFQIIVEDTGIGISDEFKNRIFERFYQIDNRSEQASGTGIGLALTRELILLYGGKISLISELGKGSTFFVNLPCGPKHFKVDEVNVDVISSYQNSSENYYLDQFGSFSEDMDDMKLKLDKTKDTILLVEDNKDIVYFLKEQFSEDFNFVFSFDGENGLQKAFSLMPQIIILDVMMPKMNGFELCEKLKKDERTCHIPVIFLTALAEKTEQLVGLEYGADDYLTKPFDVDLLRLKILNLIEIRKKLKLIYYKKLSPESFDAVPESPDEKLIQRIIKIVSKELANPAFGVEELSKSVGLSRMHLYRKMTEITQQTPVEFIRNTRLAKAASLLEQNKFYVSEVAFMTGFTEMSYFRKIFKDFYGVTPSDYAAGKK